MLVEGKWEGNITTQVHDGHGTDTMVTHGHQVTSTVQAQKLREAILPRDTRKTK
jgi:hypothetical protein